MPAGSRLSSLLLEAVKALETPTEPDATGGSSGGGDGDGGGGFDLASASRGFVPRQVQPDPERSAWADSLQSPYNNRLAGINEGGGALNTYGQMSVPVPGFRGRGEMVPIEKPLVDDTGVPNLPSSNLDARTLVQMLLRMKAR